MAIITFIFILYFSIISFFIISSLRGKVTFERSRMVIRKFLFQMRARRKVAVTVLAFVLVFAACFLPSHVFMMWFYY